MRKLILFIASSLDGYIAGANEDLGWLDAVEGRGDNGYGEFYSTVDTVLMGRRTYDWIMAHSEDFPYPEKDCYVFSRTPRADPAQVRFVAEDPAAFAQTLKGQSGGNIWLVGGGDLLRTFLRARLVDEIILTLAPVLLGQGIPLFPEGEAAMELLELRRYGQFAVVHYRVRQEEEDGSDVRYPGGPV